MGIRWEDGSYAVAEGQLFGAFAVEDEIRPNLVKPSPNFIGLASGSP